jgi:transposase InsO family protein
MSRSGNVWDNAAMESFLHDPGLSQPMDFESRLM